MSNNVKINYEEIHFDNEIDISPFSTNGYAKEMTEDKARLAKKQENVER